MFSEVADRMANRVDPNQTAPTGAKCALGLFVKLSDHECRGVGGREKGGGRQKKGGGRWEGEERKGEGEWRQKGRGGERKGEKKKRGRKKGEKGEGEGRGRRKIETPPIPPFCLSINL